jgi:putative addiction module killer protein
MVRQTERSQSTGADRCPYSSSSLGNPGDVKALGEGVSELRIDYGPGYRVYYVRRAEVVVILLCGGDKKTQNKDIDAAKTLARQLED